MGLLSFPENLLGTAAPAGGYAAFGGGHEIENKRGVVQDLAALLKNGIPKGQGLAFRHLGGRDIDEALEGRFTGYDPGVGATALDDLPPNSTW